MRWVLSMAVLLSGVVATSAHEAAQDKTEGADLDAPASVKFFLREEFARDLAAFLKESFPGRIKAGIVRDRATEFRPNPQVKLTVLGTRKTTKPINEFVSLFLIDVAEDLDSAFQDTIRNSMKSRGLLEDPIPERLRPRSQVTLYRLTPKKARALSLLVSNHAQAPMRIKVEPDKKNAGMRLVRVVASPDDHTKLETLLKEIDPRAVGSK